jgi:cytochrome bd-type quinol oxidase subunit 1
VLLGILLVGSNLYFWQSRPVRSAIGGALTMLVFVLALLEVAPSAVYPRSLFWLRYVFLGLALLLSLGHWLIWRSPREVVTLQVRTAGHTVLAVTGVSAVLLFLLMGVIRETARGPYTVYGQLKESDSQGVFQAPSKGFYP